MTVTGDQHRRIVDLMLQSMETGDSDSDKFLRGLTAIAPHANWVDLEKAQSDAEGIWHETIALQEAETDALLQLMPLFDGMPAGMELGECAIIKARQGDPLAIAFCRREGVKI